MKLIKIGRADSCNLRLDSDYVSDLHAEMTILDDGKIILEDKDSTNGTTVGSKKIKPGKEVEVQRGDRIMFADTELNWAKIPYPEKLTNYKAVYSIGNHYRNAIIINDSTISRFHASLRIGKDGKNYIRDNGSLNGTKVNGLKISPNIDYRIKKGKDRVICGSQDITDQIDPYLNGGGSIGKILAIAGGVLAAAAIVIAAIFLLPKLFGPKEPEFDPQNYRPTVVYVRSMWHPIVQFEGDMMPGVWDGVIELTDNTFGMQATAFFLDSEGRMGTNRHVASPWEEMSNDDKEKVRQIIERELPLSGESVEAFFERENPSIFRNILLRYIRQRNVTNDQAIQMIYTITSRIARANYTISGKIDHLTVGYPGNYYTHEDEFQRCNVLKVSDDPNIDLAILQLNTPKTPENINFLFTPDTYISEKIEPLKDDLYTIGYPAGLLWGQDDKTKSLEPTIRETKCQKEPGKYDFEFQANSVGGSSGSPVFNNKGQLVGVLYGGYAVAGGSTKAVHAKFLKKMYDEEVNM